MRVCGCTTPCAISRTTAVCNRIVDGLHLGPVECAFNADKLRSLNITHVLDLSCSTFTHTPSVTFKSVKITDEPDSDMLAILEPCLEFIASGLNNGGSVLVCCAMGISRSATVVVAHLMSTQRLSRDEALALVRVQRPQVAPNDGFMRQLLEFEAALQQLHSTSNDEQQTPSDGAADE